MGLGGYVKVHQTHRDKENNEEEGDGECQVVVLITPPKAQVSRAEHSCEEACVHHTRVYKETW